MNKDSSTDRLGEARRILVDIAKHKGHYDESYTNFLVTPEELAPYLDKASTNRAIEELERYLHDAHTNPQHDWHYIEDRINQLKKGLK